jgi:hypothetical protein
MLESAPYVPPSPDLDTAQAPDEPETSANIVGAWRGRAWQAGNKSWDLTVTFERPVGASVAAHVQYPDQRCSADWKLRSTESRHWEGEETVRTNPFGRCVDHGRVTLQLIDDDTLNWRWTGAGDSASATLERKTQ